MAIWNYKFIPGVLKDSNGNEFSGIWGSAACHTIGGKDVYVIVGYGSKALYSNDGLIFREVDMPADRKWLQVKFLKDRFFAIGYGTASYLSTTKTNALAYSYDGLTWTGVDMPISKYWNCIEYDRALNIFVASAYTSGADGYFSYSSNGTSWTDYSPYPSPSGIGRGVHTIVSGNGVFIAARAGSASYYRSTDGKTWTNYNTLPSKAGWGASFYDTNSSKFILFAGVANTDLGGKSKKYCYSSDAGLTWTQSTFSKSGEKYCAEKINGFICVPSSEYHLFISETGTSWERDSFPECTIPSGIAYGEKSNRIIITKFSRATTLTNTSSYLYSSVLPVVAFNANGGTFNANGVAVSSTSVVTDSTGKLSSFPTPTRSGYIFLGWFTSSSGGTQVTTDHVFQAGFTTLYAHWQGIYTVTFDANGGTCSTASALTNASGTLDSLPTASRSYYTFDGWYTAPSGGTKITTSRVFTKNTTVYAQYHANTYTVTWNASDNGGLINGKNSVTTTVSHGSTASPPGYTPVKTGYTLKGWYTQPSGGLLYSSVSITSNRVFYAQYNVNTYSITWDANGGAPSSTTSQVYAAAISFPEEPTRPGFTFDGWYTLSSSGTKITPGTVYSTNGRATYYAHWSAAGIGFVGITGKAKSLTAGYVGVNGKAKSLTAGYVGVNGKARKIF